MLLVSVVLVSFNITCQLTLTGRVSSEATTLADLTKENILLLKIDVGGDEDVVFKVLSYYY